MIEYLAGIIIAAVGLVIAIVLPGILSLIISNKMNNRFMYICVCIVVTPILVSIGGFMILLGGTLLY